MPDLPPIKPTDAWFVVGPDGVLFLKTARPLAEWSIHVFLTDTENWAEFEARGYRCVKLLISERGGER